MRDKRKQSGQSLVEFALLLPVLLLILAGLLDLGRAYFSYVAVTDAAAEGAAYGALNPDSDSKIITRAQHASSGLVTIDGDLIEIYPVDTGVRVGGTPITVTVSYSHTLATPIINRMVPGGVLVLRATATEVILPAEISSD